MLLILLLWVASILGAMAGWWLAGRNRTVAQIFAGVSCATLVTGAYAAKNLQIIPEWLLVPATARLESSWYAPGALLLFFVAARIDVPAEFGWAQWRRFQRKVWLLFALAFVVFAGATIAAAVRMDWGVNWFTAAAVEKARVDENGVVRQSTGFTCGAAAAATLLRRVGADGNASEAQMIPLCMTQPWGGATTLGIAVGVAEVARPAGLHVRIMQPNWDNFCRLRLPVLCAVKYGEMINHAVVVVAVDQAQGVLVADPIGGQCWWPLREFRGRYLDEAITVYGDQPFAAP